VVDAELHLRDWRHGAPDDLNVPRAAGEW